MKVLQVYAEYVQNKFGAVVLRFTYKNLNNTDQADFIIDVHMRSNELLVKLDQDQTFNLLRNFTEHLKGILINSFHKNVTLDNPYYYQDEINEGWLRKNHEGDIKGVMITA